MHITAEPSQQTADFLGHGRKVMSLSRQTVSLGFLLPRNVFRSIRQSISVWLEGGVSDEKEIMMRIGGISFVLATRPHPPGGHCLNKMHDRAVLNCLD